MAITYPRRDGTHVSQVLIADELFFYFENGAARLPEGSMTMPPHLPLPQETPDFVDEGVRFVSRIVEGPHGPEPVWTRESDRLQEIQEQMNAVFADRSFGKA